MRRATVPLGARSVRRNATMAFVAAVLFSASAAEAEPKQNFAAEREQMVRDEVAGAGIKDPRVLDSIRQTPRHEFMPANVRALAYLDMAVPIGDSQTISPPFVVAYMTESLEPKPGDRVLEIGTGSGYQAAILSPLVAEVYSIEIVENLGRRAAQTLKRLGYKNVFTRVGDGFAGWPEKAPFDKIIVTCSPENVPQALVDQLRDGGMLIIPLGERYRQTLFRFVKQQGELKKQPLLPTLFVPMTGEAESKRDVLPDPSHPKLFNGGFEELYEAGRPEPVVGWHYQRQLEVRGDHAPEGEHYICFENAQPGRGAQCLQGFAIDGRAIHELVLSAQVALDNVRPGQSPQQLPVIGITFYDERRATVVEDGLGPWRGSFEWRAVERTLRVPRSAREAIVRVGLFGAVGTARFDNVQVTPVAEP